MPEVAQADVRQVYGRTEIDLLVQLARGGDRDVGQSWPGRGRDVAPAGLRHGRGRAILDAVDRGFPPAVLVSNGSHWVTVTGYLPGTGPQDARLIGGRWVSEIHLNDPYEDDISSITVDGWFDEELTPYIIGGPVHRRRGRDRRRVPRTAHRHRSRHHTWHHTRAPRGPAKTPGPPAARSAKAAAPAAKPQSPPATRPAQEVPWKTISASLPRAARR